MTFRPNASIPRVCTASDLGSSSRNRKTYRYYRLLLLPWSSKVRAIAAAQTCHPWVFTVRKTCKVVIMIGRSRRGLQAVEQVTGAKSQVSCLLSWSCERNSGSQAPSNATLVAWERPLGGSLRFFLRVEGFSFHLCLTRDDNKPLTCQT